MWTTRVTLPADSACKAVLYSCTKPEKDLTRGVQHAVGCSAERIQIIVPKGIEPLSWPCKSLILPLNYGTKLVGHGGLTPPISQLSPRSLKVKRMPQKWRHWELSTLRPPPSRELLYNLSYSGMKSARRVLTCRLFFRCRQVEHSSLWTVTVMLRRLWNAIPPFSY